MVALPGSGYPAAPVFVAEPVLEDPAPDDPVLEDAPPDVPDPDEPDPDEPEPDEPDAPPDTHTGAPAARSAGRVLTLGGTPGETTAPHGGAAQSTADRGVAADVGVVLAPGGGQGMPQFPMGTSKGWSPFKVTEAAPTGCPAEFMAVRVPSDAPPARSAGIDAARTAHPSDVGVESILPPVNTIRTWVTVGPVATATTAVGSPSGWPTTSLVTAVTGCEWVAGADPKATPTILAVDTSTWIWGTLISQPTGRAAGLIGAVRNTRRSTPALVVRVNSGVS
jgi:hypothetical protein